MSDPNQTYEGLGVFYLGRSVDPATLEVTPVPLLYDSRDLVTHAAIVGVLGAGLMGLSASGGFEPWRPVSGREAIDVVDGLARLAGP